MRKKKILILRALIDLGGRATSRQIAEWIDFPDDEVAATLGTMPNIACLGGRGPDARWQFNSSS